MRRTNARTCMCVWASRGRAYKRAVMARAAVVRYDIWYKDGDRDMDVPPTHVRATRSTTTTPNKRASPDKGVPTHHRSPVSTVDAADVRENSDKALPLVDGATMAGVGQGVHIGAVFDGTGTTTSSVEHSVGSGGNNNDSNRGGGSEVASFEAGVGSGDTGRHVRVWETRKNLPPALRELLSFNSKVIRDCTSPLSAIFVSLCIQCMIFNAFVSIFCFPVYPL